MMFPVYPVLAMFWFMVGVLLALLWYHAIPTGFEQLDEHQGKLAVFAFLLCAYNLVRATLDRRRRQARREVQEMMEPPPRPRPVEEDRPIDPTFDFTDKPAAPPPEKPPS